MKAQTVAIQSWREQHGAHYAELQQIKQPTLVVNGRHDIMVPTINSYILSPHIPNAELILYPDSGHGSLFQYPNFFHQHFNVGATAALYLALRFNSNANHTGATREERDSATSKSVREGGDQIECDDQDPRVHPMFVAACADHGVAVCT